jgi:hypothetical protein
MADKDKSFLDKTKELLGYSGKDAAHNIVKDTYGAVVGLKYETLAHHAGEAGAALKKVGTVVGSAMDGFEAVQNIHKGNYRGAVGNVCSATGGVVGGAVAGILATPESGGMATIPAGIAGSYFGGKIGENGCKWVYDKLQSEVSPELLNQPISPTMGRILNDNLAHVERTAQEMGLSWDKGLDQTVIASASSARAAGLKDVEIFSVKNGEIHMGSSPDRVGARDYTSINAHQVANTSLADGWNLVLSADAKALSVENNLAQNLNQTRGITRG